MMIGLDSSVSGQASAIGPILGAGAATGAGLQAPFILSAGVMSMGTLAVIP